ncbi:MAG: polysaccharide biosynthesis/export family protein [Acidobacteriota bacterium]
MAKTLSVLAGGLLLALAGALNGQTPSAPAAAPVEAPTARADGGALPKAVDVKTYEIGVNDVLQIEVWQSPEYSRRVLVSPDGRISMPSIGPMQAEGLTPERLQAQLQQALKEFIKDPDVTVSLMQVNSKSYRVTGAVNRPTTYPLVSPIRVYEAIVDAGGFREYAKKKKVIIMRGAQRLEFNAEDYEKGKQVDDTFTPGQKKVGNILIQNNDIVKVDE